MDAGPSELMISALTKTIGMSALTETVGVTALAETTGVFFGLQETRIESPQKTKAVIAMEW